MKNQSFPSQFQVPKGYEDFVTNSEDLLKQFQSYQDLETNDEVVYSIYLHDACRIKSSEDYAQAVAKLHVFQEKIFEDIKFELSSYIWFLERFQLTPVIQEDSKKRLYICLKGKTKVGENVEDEWFIVYLLLQISKLNSNCSIQVRDKDGEFLLIEVSEYLDDWLSPENSENRVWIHQGAVHIIPKYFEVKDLFLALDCLQSENTSSETVANHHIEEMVAQRTSNIYPQRMLALNHYSLCIVPSWVAQLVSSDPSVLPIAINAFTNTGTAELSPILSKFNLQSIFSKTSPNIIENNSNKEKMDSASSIDENALQLVSLRFSRILYAKCLFKKFKTPRKYHNWMRRVSLSQSSKVMKAFDLGCRITAGLEIALSQEWKQQTRELQNNNLIQQENDQKLSEMLFQKLKIPLNNNIPHLSRSNSHPIVLEEYFDDYQSFLHPETKLISRVSRILLDSDSFTSTNGTMVSCSQETDQILFAPFTVKNTGKESSVQLLRNDEESWMYLTPEEFDKEMDERMKNVQPPHVASSVEGMPQSAGKSHQKEKQAEVPPPSTHNSKNNNNISQEKTTQQDMSSKAENLQNIVNEFKDFLNEKSDFEGIQNRTHKPSEKKKTNQQKVSKKPDNLIPNNVPTSFSSSELKGMDDLDMNLIQSLLSQANIKETVLDLPILPEVSPSSQPNGNNPVASQSQNGLQGIAERILHLQQEVLTGNNRKNTKQSSVAEEELDSDDEVSLTELKNEKQRKKDGNRNDDDDDSTNDSDDENDSDNGEEDDEDEENEENANEEEFDSDDQEEDEDDEDDDDGNDEQKEISIQDYQVRFILSFPLFLNLHCFCFARPLWTKNYHRYPVSNQT
jgi:hypothetical protein